MNSGCFLSGWLNTQHSSLNIHHSTFNTQHSTLITQHSTFNTHHSSLNTQHSTLITQHSSFNTHHSPFIPSLLPLYDRHIVGELAPHYGVLLTASFGAHTTGYIVKQLFGSDDTVAVFVGITAQGCLQGGGEYSV